MGVGRQLARKRQRLRSRFSRQVFSPPCQEPGYRIGYRFQQDPVFRTEGILAIALNTKYSKFARGQLHRDEYLGTRFRKFHLIELVAARTQRMLSLIGPYGEIYTHPGVVPPVAQQFDHVLQRRVRERRRAGREDAFDVSQKLAGGKIDFQGLVPSGKKNRGQFNCKRDGGQ